MEGKNGEKASAPDPGNKWVETYLWQKIAAKAGGMTPYSIYVCVSGCVRVYESVSVVVIVFMSMCLCEKHYKNITYQNYSIRLSLGRGRDFIDWFKTSLTIIEYIWAI